MEIKNLKKVAQRIKKAIKKGEKIILYGDADLDGVSSVIILKETIKNLGGEVLAVYFPNREIEGYGINESALNFLKKFAPALLITLDCGIGNFKEVKLAKKLGFEVIIIDHHEVLDRLPSASIIVDPKQKGDKYKFKGLATAGIIFKLSQILSPKMADSLRRNFLELVALSTIADMMPQEEENKIFIEEGLSSLENSWRPGLRAFFEINELQNSGNIRMTVQKIISALNSTEVKNHSNETYLILTSDSLERAKVIARDLLEKLYQKQTRIREITNEVEEKILKKLDSPIIFEGDVNWPLVLVGPVASKICNLYKKPTFIFKKRETESRGAVRTPSGIDAVEIMKKCSKYLLTYGGHPQAAGFAIKNENLEKFKQCLISHLSQ
jgi:single-stranded-DNA-specific exonuclease